MKPSPFTRPVEVAPERAPADDDAERDLLGALILRPERWPVAVAAGLTRDHFRREYHRHVCDAFAAVAADGTRPDEALVRSYMSDKRHHDMVTFARLTDGTPVRDEAAVRCLVRRLHDVSHARRTFYALGTGRDRIANDPLTTSEVLDTLASLRNECPTPTDVEPLLDTVELLNVPSVPSLVHDLLPVGAFAMLAGPPSVGKTFVALSVGVAVATGRPWLGRAVTPGPVIYVAGEGVGGFAPRVRAALRDADLPLNTPCGLFVRPQPLALSDHAGVRRFVARFAGDVVPRLIVLDTLARCAVGLDENSARDMGALVAACDLVRTRLGCAVLLLHHTRKDEASERGSGALRGAVDTLLTLRAQDDVVVLTVEKQKDGPAATPMLLALVRYEGSLVVRHANPKATADGTTPAQRALLQRLRDVFGPQGATARELLDASPDLTRSSFYRALHVLKQAGLITEHHRRYRAEVLA